MSQYHPIGTIVKLELDDNLLFMIAGYLPKREKSKTFDYFGVSFPLGLIDETRYICFDKDSITEVIHEGHCSEECEKVLNGFDTFAEKCKEKYLEIGEE